MAFLIRKKALPSFPYARYEGISLEKGKETEYLLTNGLGGYCSSTILGLNTRKYHGLLVSSRSDLSRSVLLQKIDEAIHSKDTVNRLGCDDINGQGISEGWRQITSLDYDYGSVCFSYNTWAADVTKQIGMVEGMNAIIISYDVSNKMHDDIEFRANLYVNSRGIYDLTKAGSLQFDLKFFDENILAISSDKGYLSVYSDKAKCSANASGDNWVRNVFYSKDHERGDTNLEDVYFPASFSIKLEPGAREEFSIVAIGYENEEKTAEAFQKLQGGNDEKGRVLSSGIASSVMQLLSQSRSFVVNRGEKRTVIAGYHWFGEWGRDAMISLPGLTLINGRLDDARLILEHFLESAGPSGIPNRFDAGKLSYSDFDSSLWLIDRLCQYMKYAGPDKALPLIASNYQALKGILNRYISIEMDGVIRHSSGTWMDTLHRNDAVEIQALWYNALKVMEKFAEQMGDPRFDVSKPCERIEKKFFDLYWNGHYLDDCLADHSLRPNQLIAISLDHRLVDDASSKKILDIVSKELLTPYGLRTLGPKDSKYQGRYEGDFSARERSYHNGTVWPWLLGPYIKAHMRLYNRKKEMAKLLEPLFTVHLKEAGIGTISEVFDGDEPHRPGGCISQAWSVAEPLRAYFEDVMGKKPPYRSFDQ